ncbi:hypothetical protein COU91_04020 [Candidatus Saccharibacteria bacterium CG10_big_fil_rev_8_21_14_0_10_47_8]|nr:MAG: hypothetical protein COU91_04020 [Candidatus Saccharibacteria bacterium CG10_big_fil_rev_8_21_14_0_10_47_8]
MPKPKTTSSIPFSVELEAWLKSSKPKTLHGLDGVFAEKSFGVLFVILLAIPALPVPTGGLTHIFEIIAMLVALQVIVGRKTLWLPDRWKNRSLGSVMEKRVLPTLIKYIRKLEKFSRPRLDSLLGNRLAFGLFGVSVLIFSLAAFLAPPFSGLDTLPALAVVMLSLGIILEDIVLIVIGLVIGTVGIAVIISLGEIIVKLIGG